MKIVSIDIETTGLNPETDKILDIGLVVYDTADKDDFSKTLDLKLFYDKDTLDSLNISDYVKNLNKGLLDDLEKAQTDEDYFKQIGYVYDVDAIDLIADFLEKNGVNPDKVNVCGKNFAGFDKLFLDNLPRRFKDLKFRVRTIDIAVLYVDWSTDYCLPDLQTCVDRSGLFESKTVSHTALDDALVTLKLLVNKI